LRLMGFDDFWFVLVEVEPGVVFTRLTRRSPFLSLTGDLGSDPRDGMARTRMKIWIIRITRRTNR